MRRAPVLLVPVVLLGALLVGCGGGEGQEAVDAGGEVVVTVEESIYITELEIEGDADAGSSEEPVPVVEEHVGDPLEPTYLVRTDFSDDAAWRRVVELVTAGVDFGGGYGPYEPYVETLEDRDLEGVTAAEMVATVEGGVSEYRIIADARSMREAAAGGEVTVVYVDVSAPFEDEVQGFPRELRTVTTEVASIESNLSVSNLWLSDFAVAADADGVFRGYR